MRVYVPSYMRAYRIGQPGVKQLPAYFADRSQLTYVVRESEGDTYRRKLKQHFPGVEVVETARVGIAATRQFIGELASYAREPCFMMMDDDLKFMVRQSSSVWKLRQAEALDVTHMLQWVEVLLDDYAHVGVSTRQGNNVGPRGVLTGPPPLTVDCVRTLRCLAYRTDEFLECEHSRVPVMEDFDVNLQLLERGHMNTRVHYWCQDQRVTGEAGGCSEFRTHEMQDAAARRLVELHPGFVKLRMKKNKTQAPGDFNERTEVTVYWKKAWQSSQRDGA